MGLDCLRERVGTKDPGNCKNKSLAFEVEENQEHTEILEAFTAYL